jgi:hypothetical protein
VQQGEPLLERPLARMPVIDGLGEGQDEEPVTGRLRLRHHRESRDGGEPVEQVVLHVGGGGKRVRTEGRHDGHQCRERGQAQGSHVRVSFGGTCVA